MKLKEKFQYLKEAWKDGRKRSIIKLSLYLIFFMLVIATIKGNNNVNLTEDNKKTFGERYYSFVISNNGNEIIKGIFNNNIIEYSYNNQIYSINEGMTFQIVNNELINVNNHQIHIDRLLLNNLDDYINESTEMYKTEFNDSRIKKGYEINVEDFAYLYDNKEISNINKMNFNVTSLDNKVIEIEYDMSLYYGNTYILKITFSNFEEPVSVDSNVVNNLN